MNNRLMTLPGKLFAQLFLIPFSVLGFATAGVTQDVSVRNPLAKPVLGETFPKAGFIFRGENRKAAGGDYEQWHDDIVGNVGIIRKFVREELDHPQRMDEARLSDYLKRYASEHPDELFLLHFNGRAKLFDFHEDQFFAGHYLQYAGVQCQSNIVPRQTVIELPSTKRFFLQKPFGSREPSDEDSIVILVERDRHGVIDWEHHEFAYLTAIDERKNTITLKRGAHGTQPRGYEKNGCYIAQIQQYRDRMMINFSLDCPQSPEGKTAADVYLDLFQNWFSQGGSLEAIDGIAFDVVYWDLNQKADTNVDGVADGGIVDGEPRWARGAYEFAKSIRERFGDDFVITADGHHEENQRAIGILSGIESEGLVQHNDGWRGISRTVNTHRYWNTFNTAKIQFSYIAAKLVNPDDAKHGKRLRRFAHAMAACLGIGCTIGIDEDVKGVEEEHYWLGKPIGPMRNLAESSNDVVYQMPDRVTEADVHAWTAGAGAVVSNHDRGGIKIGPRTDLSTQPDETAGVSSLRFELTLDLPPGDLFLAFDAKSSSALAGFEGTEVPRAISFDLDGHRRDPRVGKAALDIFSLVGPRDYFKSEFYVRNAGGRDGKKNVTIRFEVEGGGELFLKNLVIRNTPAVYVREFEHGVVLVNPSLDTYLFDLEKQFGSHTFERIQASPSSDSSDAVLNNGAIVDDPRAFAVGPVSAQFLSKQ
ncbi:enolase-like domain-containing protein [Allorhodopirellula solitaria]|nr:hypothetical protein [Allorhodopirellula solitaria]